MVFNYVPRLRDLRNQVSGYLSGGEQQMLVIGRALIARPKLFLLDEPSMGLAPMIVEEIFDIVKRIREEQGTSVMLVEQNAVAALSIADHGYVMENGKIVLDGPANKLIDNPDIKEFYLGLSELGEKKKYSEIKHYKRRKRWLV
jgi:branched-chain amino acid transport system ATP-binding protein